MSTKLANYRYPARIVEPGTAKFAFSGQFAVLLISVASLVASNGCSGAPTAAPVVGAITLGGLLDNLMSQVKEAEEKAIGGADLFQVEAGGKLSLAIQQAKAAYAASLDKTMTELSSKDQELFNSLNSTVQEFRTGTYSDLASLETKTLGIVHTLPFSKNFPQLFEYRPCYVIPPSAADEKYLLTLEGDFHDLQRPDYNAKATVVDKPFINTAKSSTLASFEFPANTFSYAPNALQTNYVMIDIPYETGSIIKKQAHTDFVLPIFTLPTTPGKVTISVTTPTTTVVHQDVTSPEMHQESGDDDIKDGGEHADLAIHKWQPDPGWQVIPSTVTYQITWSQGHQGVDQDWWFSRNISTQNEAVLCFSTEHHRIGTSGKIHFRIKFTEEKDSKGVNVTSHDIPMKWEENKVVNIPSGSTWVGSFTRFDGKVQQFSGPYTDEFLKVSQAGPAVNILANPTK